MNVTFNRPGKLEVIDSHSQDDGRALVYLEADGQWRAATFWLIPETAAQWIEALTPLAAQAKP